MAEHHGRVPGGARSSLMKTPTRRRVKHRRTSAASARDLADAYLAYFTLHSRVLQSAYEWNVALAALARATGDLTPQPKEP